MNLPTPGRTYEPGVFSRAFALISGELGRMRRRGADVELGPGERLIVTTPNGSRRRIKVDDAGAITTEAV